MYYKKGFPYAAAYSWEYSNMYRSDEETAAEEKTTEEVQNNGEARQYPGALNMPGGAGIPQTGGGQKPGMPPGQFTGNPAEIMRLIELNQPDVMRAMMAGGIPYQNARRIVMRIIGITLRYCR